MLELNNKIEEIIRILNEYGFNMKFRMGADELYYYSDKYKGYIIFNILDDTLVFVNEKNNVSKVNSTIENITDNKETLIELLKTI